MNTDASRRSFLGRLLAGAAGGLLVPSGLTALAAGSPPPPFRADVFAPYLGSAFRVRPAAGATIHLSLEEIAEGTAKRHCAGAARCDSFSLIFTGPSHRLLGQDTYRFAHDTLGRFDLFITPQWHGDGPPRYEAVISRLVA